MLTNKEEKLIYDLILDKINSKQFYESYPIDLKRNQNYFFNKLNESVENENEDVLELCLDIIEHLSTSIDDSNIKLQSIYLELILKNWHKLHERFVDSIDKTDDTSKYFKHVLKQNYLKDQSIENTDAFMVPLWNKCLWALYEIGTDESIKTILEYKDSPYKDVSETVSNLLTKKT